MKPACAPQLSITCQQQPRQRLHLHHAGRVPRKGLGQAALVDRRLVTPTDAIRVGAIAIPLRISNRATPTGWSTNGSGSSDNASMVAPMRKRRSGRRPPDDRSGNSTGHQRSERPRNQDQAGVGSTPASLANATTLTSMPPKIMPRALEAMATGTRTRHGNRLDLCAPAASTGSAAG